MNLTAAARVPELSKHPWVTLLTACASTLETIEIDVNLFPVFAPGWQFEAGLVPFCPNLRCIRGIPERNTAVVEYTPDGSPTRVLSYALVGTYFLYTFIMKHIGIIQNLDTSPVRHVLSVTDMRNHGARFAALETALMDLEGAPPFWNEPLGFWEAAPALTRLAIIIVIPVYEAETAQLPNILAFRLQQPGKFAALKNLSLRQLNLRELLKSKTLSKQEIRVLKRDLESLQVVCNKKGVELDL